MKTRRRRRGAGVKDTAYRLYSATCDYLGCPLRETLKRRANEAAAAAKRAEAAAEEADNENARREFLDVYGVLPAKGWKRNTPVTELEISPPGRKKTKTEEYFEEAIAARKRYEELCKKHEQQRVDEAAQRAQAKAAEVAALAEKRAGLPPRPPPSCPTVDVSAGIATGRPRRNIGRVGTTSKGGTMTTRRNKSSGGDIVTHLLTIRNQVKLYHWQTGSFARHKATDDLTAALDLNIDAFVESYMGRYGRPKVSGSIKLHNFSESAAKSFVARETAYLQRELPRKIGKEDTDLLNLRDTILGDLTKVLYLFTLA